MIKVLFYSIIDYRSIYIKLGFKQIQFLLESLNITLKFLNPIYTFDTALYSCNI